MLVVVVDTIVAPFRRSTTWTESPLMVAPSLGWTIDTLAGDAGRLPAGDGAPLAPDEEAVPQAARMSVRAVA
jgi:hypothetical protein